MLPPAAHDLVCRENRIILTPDRTCHQAPRPVQLLAIRSPLAFSTASCLLSLAVLSNQQPCSGEIAIYRNTYGKPNFLRFSWKVLLKASDQQNCSRLGYHRSVPNEPPTKLEYALILFLALPSNREWQAGSSLSGRFFSWSFHRGSKKEAMGKICCRGCAGG